jgi:hypothetical protein
MASHEFTEDDKARFSLGVIGYALVLSAVVFFGVIALVREWNLGVLAMTAGAFVSTLSLAVRYIVTALHPREPLNVRVRAWERF